MVEKIWTDLSVNSGLTGETRASVTPENASQERKRKKTPAMSPPIKYPIPNQNKDTLGLEKYQCLTSHVPQFASRFKSLIKRQMMIILKLQIIHVLIKMIRHVLIEMII